MKLLSSAVIAVALLALPGLAVAEAPEAVEAVEAPDTQAVEVTTEQVDVQDENMFGVMLVDDTVLPELMAKSDPDSASCSARTTCSQGTITCSGTSFCWSEPRCFIICDGNMIRCNNPCP